MSANIKVSFYALKGGKDEQMKQNPKSLDFRMTSGIMKLPDRRER